MHAFAQQLNIVVRWATLGIFTTLLTAGCGATLDNSKSTALKLPDISEAIGNSNSAVKKGSPIELYTLVARGIKSCWFSGARPDFKKYIFFAETSQDTSEGAAEISIHELDKNGRRGLKAFEVKFHSADGGTYVAPKNHRLDAVMSEQLEAAIDRYANNDLSCNLSSSRKAG